MTRSLPILFTILLLLSTVVGGSGGRHEVALLAPAQAVLAAAGNAVGLISVFAESSVLRVCPDTDGLRRMIEDEDWRVSVRSWLSVPDFLVPLSGPVLLL